MQTKLALTREQLNERIRNEEELSRQVAILQEQLRRAEAARQAAETDSKQTKEKTARQIQVRERGFLGTMSLISLPLCFCCCLFVCFDSTDPQDRL